MDKESLESDPLKACTLYKPLYIYIYRVERGPAYGVDGRFAIPQASKAQLWT